MIEVMKQVTDRVLIGTQDSKVIGQSSVLFING